jgi:hypothetical protein
MSDAARIEPRTAATNLKPYLASSDGAFRLELGGLLQLDYDAVDDDARGLTGSELADRFLVRRARIDLSGRAFQWVDFKIEADLTEGVSLKDAYLDFRFLPELRLRGGQFKPARATTPRTRCSRGCRSGSRPLPRKPPAPGSRAPAPLREVTYGISIPSPVPRWHRHCPIQGRGRQRRDLPTFWRSPAPRPRDGDA